MPESVSCRVSIYHKLAKGEEGITQADSVRMSIKAGIGFLLGELPEEALTVTEEGGKVTVVIDWARVPASVLVPKLPPRK